MYNTNLMHAISHNTDRVTQREAFLSINSKVLTYNTPKLIDERLLLENEKNKSFEQVKDVEQAYVVADDIEVRFGNKIAL